MEKIALIVAGGSGSRMQTRIPKQFLLLKGHPVLMYSLEKFWHYDRSVRMILVLPTDQMDVWKRLCEEYKITLPHELRPGGESRFHSVKNNLADIPDHVLVAVHDGVRPLVSLETIERCFTAAYQYGNAVPCIKISETLRKLDDKGSRQEDRSQFRLVQTPQVFESSILKKAYCQEYQSIFTDDAGVVENLGYPIHLVEGNPENIKITLKRDLGIAASLMENSGKE